MHLWQQQDGWTRIAIAAPIAIGHDAIGVLTSGPPSVARGVAIVVPFDDSGARGAALVSSGASGVNVTVNGYPPLDVAILKDRDEIGVAGTRFFFGAYDAPVHVRVLPDGADTRCARCGLRFVTGEEMVRCPLCSGPHHAVAPRASDGSRVIRTLGDDADPPATPGCWDYDPSCGACHRPAAASVWTPDEEASDASS